MSVNLNRVCWIQQGRVLFILCIVLVHIPLFAQHDASYWNAHLAILDMRTRAVGATAYVREIRLRNFQDADSLPVAFGFGADLFADHGAGFDLAPADGVYTSERCYAYHPGLPVVALGFVLAGTDFNHTDALTASYAAHPASQPGPGAMPLRVVQCRLKLCPCPLPCLCFACEWGDGAWCLDWCDCQGEVFISW